MESCRPVCQTNFKGPQPPVVTDSSVDFSLLGIEKILTVILDTKNCIQYIIRRSVLFLNSEINCKRLFYV